MHSGFYTFKAETTLEQVFLVGSFFLRHKSIYHSSYSCSLGNIIIVGRYEERKKQLRKSLAELKPGGRKASELREK